MWNALWYLVLIFVGSMIGWNTTQPDYAKAMYSWTTDFVDVMVSKLEKPTEN